MPLANGHYICAQKREDAKLKSRHFVRICWWPTCVRRHGPAGRSAGYATTLSPKPRVSVSVAGLADTYLASPAHPRIRIGLVTTVAWIPPAERPETCSRPSGSPPPPLRVLARAAEVSGCGRGWRASGTGGEYTIPPIGTPPQSSPATPRRPAPVTRPLWRWTPARTLASPFRGRRAGALGGRRERWEWWERWERWEDGERRAEDGRG